LEREAFGDKEEFTATCEHPELALEALGRPTLRPRDGKLNGDRGEAAARR
jgi:hypothetical protein